VHDPRGANEAEIQRLVKKGFLVRTRSDEPVATIRDKDDSRAGIALASGAQYVTTDFPVAGMAARYDSDFRRTVARTGRRKTDHSRSGR
jgi:hypothetical protein